MTVGGRTGGRSLPNVRGPSVGAKVGSQKYYLVRGCRLIGVRGHADSRVMARLETPTDALRDRALTLSAEIGIDSGTWYLRVLEESRVDDVEADLGALVRAYWELQRVTGRADLRGEWRSLADRLWQDS
jgi:hypothetical protein